MVNDKYQDTISVRTFGGASHPLNKSQSCVGVHFANSGTSLLMDFGEYATKADLGANVKGIVSAEGLDFLKNKADYLFISHAHEDHINGLFHIFEAGHKIEAPIVATPDTLDFLVRTAEDKGIDLAAVAKRGFVPIKKGMDITRPIDLDTLKDELKEWKSYDHYEKESPEYKALYNGITVPFGNGDMATFFSVSHMLGAAGVRFITGDKKKTQFIYPADYTFDKDIFFGVPTNKDLVKKFGKEAPSILLTDIMWANSPITEEFQVGRTVEEYTERFKAVKGVPLAMVITPEYNEPLFAYMKAAYQAGRKNVILHMSPAMEKIVQNLCESVDIKKKIGEDFNIHYSFSDDAYIPYPDGGFDIFDRAADGKDGTFAEFVEGGYFAGATVFCSQTEKYPILARKAQEKGYTIVKMPAIKAHPTRETVEEMIEAVNAKVVLPIHANQKDTRVYLDNHTDRQSGFFDGEKIINLAVDNSFAAAFKGCELVDSSRSGSANQLCFVESNGQRFAIKVPEKMLRRGVERPVDNSVAFMNTEALGKTNYR